MLGMDGNVTQNAETGLQWMGMRDCTLRYSDVHCPLNTSSVWTGHQPSILLTKHYINPLPFQPDCMYAHPLNPNPVHKMARSHLLSLLLTSVLLACTPSSATPQTGSRFKPSPDVPVYAYVGGTVWSTVGTEIAVYKWYNL